MSDYTVNPFYQDFIKHPFIQTIADKKCWTVSDNKKRPIDMIEFRDHHIVKGAIFSNEKSLVDLYELNTILPNAANYAFYLEADEDNFVVLDIEPSCPDNIKSEFLKMNPLYMETSMSGKGIHMIFEYPKHIIEKYPNALSKSVFRGENHEYEILIDHHYVTFTGRQIPFTPNENPASFEDLFEKLAKDQKPTAEKAELDIKEMQPVETEQLPFLMTLLRTAMDDYKKTPNDFKKKNGIDNDTSLWEYAVIGYMYSRLQDILKVQAIANEHKYTIEEQIWIMYQLIYDYIDYRPKHDGLRNGRAFIVYMMESIIASYKED